MTRRILPPEEWPRLTGTALDGQWPFLQPDRSRVVVVENRDGEIVACWAFYLHLHAHGCWIRDDHRGKSAVARHLIKAMHEQADAAAAQTIWTGAEDTGIATMLTNLGGIEPQMRTFVVPMRPPKGVQ